MTLTVTPHALRGWRHGCRLAKRLDDAASSALLVSLVTTEGNAWRRCARAPLLALVRNDTIEAVKWWAVDLTGYTVDPELLSRLESRGLPSGWQAMARYWAPSRPGEGAECERWQVRHCCRMWAIEATRGTITRIRPSVECGESNTDATEPARIVSAGAGL